MSSLVFTLCFSMLIIADVHLSIWVKPRYSLVPKSRQTDLTNFERSSTLCKRSYKKLRVNAQKFQALEQNKSK